jgi:uncharacterized membrane protein
MKELFTPEAGKRITEAIVYAEKQTSGEVRLHVEKKCSIDPFDRATKVFRNLKMHRTDLHNGVLIYLAVESRKFAIIGDSGIDKAVPADFWNTTKTLMQGYFEKGEIIEGLVKGISMAGEQLKTHFPLQSGDRNELSNDISFGK